MSDRDRFEAWISAPPFERTVSRFPMSESGWSGQHVKYLAVQLAWEAWCAASEQRVEREKALEDALSHTTDLLEGRDFAKRHYEMIERTKANQELLNQESDNE